MRYTIAQGMKGKVYISFSRSSYLSGIATPIGENDTSGNEVEVSYSDERYLQRCFATKHFYATRGLRFKIIMLKEGSRSRSGGAEKYGLQRYYVS